MRGLGMQPLTQFVTYRTDPAAHKFHAKPEALILARIIISDETVRAVYHVVLGTGTGAIVGAGMAMRAGSV